MKQFLKKPLGLAVSATMAMAGLAAFSSAHAFVDADNIGDAAIIPYYTVKDNFITGVHITNTSDRTQALKVRLRRDSDSADVLDFNIVLSPYDVWVGSLSDDAGSLRFNIPDNTCTSPKNSGSLVAPTDLQGGHLTGADEGYIEVIGMGQAVLTAADGTYPNSGNNTDIDGSPVSVAAKHNTSGVPANCTFVDANFTAAAVVNNGETVSGGDTTFWEESDNAFKVSYFIRDSATGMEFGNNSVHIKNFSDEPMMTNQQNGLVNNDPSGFDFPNLNGGGANCAVGGCTQRYDDVIRRDLGASAILNDWSYNAANGVSTDWVVTLPGQYLMVSPIATYAVNHRDIPVKATFTIFDREEDEASPGETVVSPGVGVASTALTNEVNVIEWGGQSVFNSAADNVHSASPAASGIDAPYGWSLLTLASQIAAPQRIYDLRDSSGQTYETDADDDAGTPGIQSDPDGSGPLGAIVATSDILYDQVPVIGFTAWQRTFTDASKNYGRIIEHSRLNNN